MENACEAAITSLEKRTAKLQQWRAISLEVGNQEVQQLESAVAALQQQQQQLQQHRMEALPAIETAAAADLKELKKSWGTVIPSSKAKDKCKELWASLAQVKDTRKAAADELTAKLNDAFGEAEKAINEEAKARRHAEEVLNE
ncbi:hypothetical protein, conserved [Eimeria maxima]|uniref:Uncharacterized protein n=1 Tax=Eimeria maxima TaxID=5804 RepID=U6MIY0_EIMMA|nr:hypothetical protein, conserved [Eimeria maxima]CDJ61590.1 hypothetical protein, conserved [Eimeria maxima]